MDKNSFPKELTALKQWVCWRLEPDKKSGRDTKVPYSPGTGHRASASNPSTWGTLDEAVDAKDKYSFSGIGFVFTEDCGIVGIDIDHCLNDGKPNEVATDILSRLPPTYIEISPSGTGLHIFLRGKLPSGGNRNSKHGVEMYSSSRYFTMTGVLWKDCVDTIADDNGAIEWIHKTFITPLKRNNRTVFKSTTVVLTDDELLKLAYASKDGESFGKLYSGEWQGKYKSQSEADFALCCKLAFWSGRSEAQIDRLFRKSGLYRDKWDARHSADGTTYGEQTVKNACVNTTQVYTPTQHAKEPEIFEQYGCYYRRRGDKFYQITNFIVDPIEMITAEDEAQLTCDLVTDSGERFRQNLTASDMTTVQKFKGVLNKKTIALSFLGSEGDLEMFKMHIYKLKWLKKRGVKALGIYPRKKKLVFVDTNGAVGVGGTIVKDMVQMEKYKSLESKILSAPLVDKTGLLLVAKHIMSYNEPAKTVPILAWIAACFIKPHLRRSEVKFPHLFLIGESGSGKSNTLEKVVLPMFSRSKVTASSQITAFTLMKESCSSNIFPQAFDEFKPSKLDKVRLNALYNHFRDSYDCHEGIRGRADQSTVTYDLLAPIAVSGEESADEASIRERAVELLFSKRDINNPECKANFESLTANKRLLNLLGRSLLDTALDTTVAEVEKWFDEGKEHFNSGLPTRVHDNLCCLYAGICLLGKLCRTLGTGWVDAFPYDNEECAKHIEYAAREYLLDGGLNNKSIVEQSFEVMSRMRLKHGMDYVFENNNQYLFINIYAIYDRYTRYRKDCAIVGEVLPYHQFMKQLEHSEFFVAKNRQKKFGGKNRKVWVVDYSKLSGRCDVGGFAEYEDDDVS